MGLKYHLAEHLHLGKDSVVSKTSSSCRAASTDIPDPGLATSPYRLSLLAGLQGYIPYPHIATECMFELVVLLLPGHIWGVYHL